MTLEFNESEVRKALELLHGDNVFEVRVLGSSNGFPQTYTGLFDNIEDAISALKNFNKDGKYQVYHILNKVKWSKGDGILEAKLQHNKLVKSKTAGDGPLYHDYVVTTADADMVQYEWLFIDLDPKRDADISSSDAEKKQAYDLIEPIKAYIQQKYGLSNPIICDSGNGYHLLYHADLPATDETKQRIGIILEDLSKNFENEFVSIDKTVKNPARLTKLYGTRTHKGKETELRPHRYSEVLVYG